MTVSGKYQKIIKYLAEAVCTQPLHIGSASGSNEEVLEHPTDGMPFVQASSISGVLRQYYAKRHEEERVKELFGSGRTETGTNALDGASKVRFSDGIFCRENLILELRPRVKINPETGTCDSSTITGTDRQAGHKFNMESIGAGAEFTFSMYLYEEELQADLEEILTAVHQGAVQLGGQKSNGCGFLELKSLKRAVFDMTREDDRRKWADEEELPDSAYENMKLSELKTQKNRAVVYEITVNGSTEGELLVKSIAVRDYGKDAPDSMNMQNAAGEYIVPGSSLKGAFRSRMEKIAAYLGNDRIIEETFGRTGKSHKEGKTGNIIFYDTVVGNKEENDMAKIKSRIHLDKFTGGVIHGGLFNEKNAAGELTFHIAINDRNNPDASCGLLLLALRDLAIGAMSIGGGYSVGKGIVDVEKITVRDHQNGCEAEISVKDGVTADEGGIVPRCLGAVQIKETAV